MLTGARLRLESQGAIKDGSRIIKPRSRIGKDRAPADPQAARLDPQPRILDQMFGLNDARIDLRLHGPVVGLQVDF